MRAARRRTAALLGVALALGVAAPATIAPAASSIVGRIIADAADNGQLDGTYTPAQLRQAKASVPLDSAQYGDIADVIAYTQLGGRPAPPSGLGGPGRPVGYASLLAPSDTTGRSGFAAVPPVLAALFALAAAAGAVAVAIRRRAE